MHTCLERDREHRGYKRSDRKRATGPARRGFGEAATKGCGQEGEMMRTRRREQPDTSDKGQSEEL